MLKNSIFISLVAFLLLLGFLLLRQDKTYPLPTEESASVYLQTIEQDVEELNGILRSIQSPQQADEAIYALAAILPRQKAARNRLCYENLKGEDAARRLRFLLQTDEKRLSEQKYVDFLHEVRRLQEAENYHSDALFYLIRTFFVEDVNRGLLPKWLLSARLCAAWGMSDVGCRTSLSEQVGDEAFLSEALNLRTTFSEEAIPLTALDALQRAGERADEEPSVTLVSPTSASLRGEHSVFLDCFCPRYCFRQGALPQMGSGQRAEQCPRTLGDIVSMSKEAALQNPALFAVQEREEDTFIIFRLEPPFKSRFLVTEYAKGEQFPSSFIFTDSFSDPRLSFILPLVPTDWHETEHKHLRPEVRTGSTPECRPAARLCGASLPHGRDTY